MYILQLFKTKDLLLPDSISHYQHPSMSNSTVKEKVVGVHELMCTCLFVCHTPSITLLTGRLESQSVTDCVSLGS